jgi:hypothetical protein
MNVLTIQNKHLKECGQPPNLINKDCYIGYFENDYGEQLVFKFDYTKKHCTLYHGDCGWDNPIILQGQPIRKKFFNIVPSKENSIVISDEEYEWLSMVYKQAMKRLNWINQKRN